MTYRNWNTTTTRPERLTVAALTDMAAQLDDTAPYYLPRLLRDTQTLVSTQVELLAALKGMVRIYDGVRDVVMSRSILDTLAAADTAIAKAEGRS